MSPGIDYLQIVKQAASDTWKHKAVWLFGLFLAVGGGGGPNLNYSLGGGGGGRGGMSPDELGGQLDRLRDIDMASLIPMLVAVGIFMLFVALVFFVLRLVSEAGLVGMGRDIAMGGSPGVGDGFRVGGRYWLRMLVIDFVLALPLILIIFLGVAVVVLLVIGAVGAGGSDLAPEAVPGLLCGVFSAIGVMVVLAIPFAIVLGVIGELARRHAVLLDSGPFQAMSEGWHMLRTRFKEVALMWLTMLAVGIVVGLVTGLVGAIVIIPGVILLLLNAVAGAVLLVPGALLLLFVSGVVQAFVSLAWTDFFLVVEPSAMRPEVHGPIVA